MYILCSTSSSHKARAQDFLKESKLLYDLLKNSHEADLELITQFKNWSINDVIGHLYLFNVAAIKTVDGAKFFDDFISKMIIKLSKAQNIKVLQQITDQKSRENLKNLYIKITCISR
mgnify:CR=1 FL=1